MSHGPSRREFLGTVGAAGIGLGTVDVPVRCDASAASSEARRAVGFGLGIASYSLRSFSRAYAIQAIQALGTPYVNIKSFHLPYEASEAELKAGRAEFESADLQIVGGGTVTLHVDSDEDIRRYFEYARVSGMPLMVIAPTRQTLPRIERFVQEYTDRRTSTSRDLRTRCPSSGTWTPVWVSASTWGTRPVQASTWRKPPRWRESVCSTCT
jgi:hypothetical protein